MPTRKASPARKAPREDEAFAAAQQSYGAAMTLFTRQNWAKARDAFQSFLADHAEDREIPDIVDRARTHLRTCEARLASPPEPPATGEGWLREGVGLANLGRTDDALAALERALAGGANPAHVHYAKAAALAISDRHEEALSSLSLAIEADPGTRYQSLADPDFERLRETAGYVALVEPPVTDEDFPDEDEDETDFDDGADDGR